MKQLFKDVYVVKPQSSRASSHEAFVIGLDYIPGKELSEVLSTSMMGLKENLDSKIEEQPAQEEDDDIDDVLTF